MCPPLPDDRELTKAPIPEDAINDAGMYDETRIPNFIPALDRSGEIAGYVRYCAIRAGGAVPDNGSGSISACAPRWMLAAQRRTISMSRRGTQHRTNADSVPLPAATLHRGLACSRPLRARIPPPPLLRDGDALSAKPQPIAVECDQWVRNGPRR
jgi:hypothetical protein